MNKFILRSLYSSLTLALIFAFTGISDAQKRNDKDIRDAVRTLNSKLDDFEMNAKYHLQSTSADATLVSEMMDDVRVVKNVIQQFQDNFDRKRDNRDDVNGIAAAARKIDDFLASNPQNRQISDNWDEFHRELDRLAANYGLTIKADDAGAVRETAAAPSAALPGTVTVGLSGTYELDTARSENVDEIVNGTSLNQDQKTDLKDKLAAPEQIALDIRGNQVTLASSKASPVTFTADGSTKTENIGGRDVKLRATLANDKLVVSSVGGDTDFTITFTSTVEGKSLKVERRITTDYLSETVFAQSVYNKSDSVARLGIDAGGPQPASGDDLPPVDNTRNTTTGSRGSVTRETGTSTPPVRNDPPDTSTSNGGYSDNDDPNRVSNGSGNSRNDPNQGNGRSNPNGGYGRNNPNGGYGRGGGSQRNPASTSQPSVTTRPGNYTVPNGTVLTGTLETEIDTKVSQNNDRFRLTVQTPNEYRGAVIEGYLTNVRSSGRATGNASVTLNFEKITLRDGTKFDFAGNLQSAQDTMGKNVRVDSEGTLIGDSQTNQTAKRGGIGGGVGAVIGAIAGGAHGAVLGAIIGGGAGAGSVVAQGRDDIHLNRDSEITVQSSSPAAAATR